jgi:hypothetical protein
MASGRTGAESRSGRVGYIPGVDPVHWRSGHRSRVRASRFWSIRHLGFRMMTNRDTWPYAGDRQGDPRHPCRYARLQGVKSQRSAAVTTALIPALPLRRERSSPCCFLSIGNSPCGEYPHSQKRPPALRSGVEEGSFAISSNRWRICFSRLLGESGSREFEPRPSERLRRQRNHNEERQLRAFHVGGDT